MTGQFIVAHLRNIKPIEGADKIQQSTIFGETVIVPITYEEGDVGILFDIETQLSHEYCHYNNLYRDKTKNFNKEIAGYIEDNRRVRPIKLKGVKCSGLWMPLRSLDNIPNINTDELVVGGQYNTVSGIRICEKFVTQATKRQGGSNKGKSIKLNLVPTFKEHVDTDQLMRNLNNFHIGDVITITEKLHGTSGRCGYLPVLQERPNNTWFDYIFNLVDSIRNKPKEEFKYDFVVGSRKVVKSAGDIRLKYKKNSQGKKFHENESTDLWTTASNKYFKDKLNKGETIYFEIVGFEPSGNPIMGSHSNKKLEKFLDKKEYKNLIAKFGDTTTFNYGCEPNKFKIFVYRITMTNEDGVAYDLSWNQVKLRCEQLEVNHVPELMSFIIGTDTLENDYEHIKNLGETLAYYESFYFPTHIKEGCVFRIDDGKPRPTFLKHKNYVFKVLEGIIKDSNQSDIEESN